MKRELLSGLIKKKPGRPAKSKVRLTVKIETLLDEVLRDYIDAYPRARRPQLSEVVEQAIYQYLEYIKKLKNTGSEKVFKIVLEGLEKYEKMLTDRENEYDSFYYPYPGGQESEGRSELKGESEEEI